MTVQARYFTCCLSPYIAYPGQVGGGSTTVTIADLIRRYPRIFVTCLCPVHDEKQFGLGYVRTGYVSTPKKEKKPCVRAKDAVMAIILSNLSWQLIFSIRPHTE